VIGHSKDGAGHIQIARNHAAQVKRKRDPEALLSWADVQAKKMKSRYRSGRKRKRERQEHDPVERPKMIAKRQNQQGYEELHNLFSDTEVSSIIRLSFVA
jgi:N-acetyl-anhydromuramyl-L-alanine amidase AmpD